MVVDAEVPTDRGDGDATILHPGRLSRDPLVGRQLLYSAKLDLDRQRGQSAKPLRTGPKILAKSLNVNDLAGFNLPAAS